MRIEILDKAEGDLVDGFRFYESHEAGLGAYFLDRALYSDIDSIAVYAGIHRVVYRRYHRLLSRRVPFAVFYTLDSDVVRVHAVVNCRRDPTWIRKHLR